MVASAGASTNQSALFWTNWMLLADGSTPRRCERPNSVSFRNSELPTTISLAVSGDLAIKPAFAPAGSAVGVAPGAVGVALLAAAKGEGLPVKKLENDPCTAIASVCCAGVPSTGKPF